MAKDKKQTGYQKLKAEKEVLIQLIRGIAITNNQAVKDTVALHEVVGSKDLDLEVQKDLVRKLTADVSHRLRAINAAIAATFTPTEEETTDDKAES